MLPARHFASVVRPLVVALLLVDQTAWSQAQRDVHAAASVRAPECLDAQVLAINGKWLANPGLRILHQWSCLAPGEELTISGQKRTGEITVIYRRGSIPPHTEKCLTLGECRNAYTVEKAILPANPEPYIKSLIEQFFRKRQPEVVPGILKGTLRQPSPADDLAGQGAPGAVATPAQSTSTPYIIGGVAVAGGVIGAVAVGARKGANGNPQAKSDRGWVWVVVAAAAVAATVVVITVIHRRRSNGLPRPRYSFLRPAVVCEQGGYVDLSLWWSGAPNETTVKLTPLAPNASKSVSTLRWKLDKAIDSPVLFEVLGTRATPEGSIRKSFVLVAPQGSCQITQKSYEETGRFISTWPQGTPAAAVWNLQLGILADLAGLDKAGLR